MVRTSRLAIFVLLVIVEAGVVELDHIGQLLASLERFLVAFSFFTFNLAGVLLEFSY